MLIEFGKFKLTIEDETEAGIVILLMMIIIGTIILGSIYLN